MSHLFQESESANLLHRTPFLLKHELSGGDDFNLAYYRARALAKTLHISAHDVHHLTDKFWDLHMHPAAFLDGAMMSLLTIQYNLAAGMLAPYAAERPELRPLMQKVLDFDVTAQYMLTELAHGLDAEHLETTATLLPDGDFDLHTPHDGAAKFMPPTAPFGGIPRIAILIARLVVNGEDRGLRPFIVPLTDGKQMCRGVTSKILPKRGGVKPLDHAITYFNHVRLPSISLLGSLSKPSSFREAFTACVHRVHSGTLALSCSYIPTLAGATQIVASYSKRRIVTDSATGKPMPIWDYRTQQLPIIRALAQVYVFKAHMLEAIKLYTDKKLDYRVRVGVGASVKASMARQAQPSFFELSERCGAQGLFEHNQIFPNQMFMRGVAIAEGDILALSIRLATELLIGRYEMPKPRYPNCLLARHEAGLFSMLKSQLSHIPSHRSDAYNAIILPHCQNLVESIGYRMAYEAAIDLGVPQHLVDMYEATIVKCDSAWYVENAGLTWWQIHEMEERAVSLCLKTFDEDMAAVRMEEYASIAPITTKQGWDRFVRDLDVVQGNGRYELVQSPGRVEFEHARL